MGWDPLAAFAVASYQISSSAAKKTRREVETSRRSKLAMLEAVAYLRFLAVFLAAAFLATGLAAAFLAAGLAAAFLAGFAAESALGGAGSLERPSTMSFSSCPARNAGTLAAAIVSFWRGFCGLTPERALRFLRSNVPKPTSITLSPLDKAPVIECNIALTALPVCCFVWPVISATALINSALFIELPPNLIPNTKMFPTKREEY